MSEQELIERMAKAMWEVNDRELADGEQAEWSASDDWDEHRQWTRVEASAALAALHDAIPGLDALIAGTGVVVPSAAIQAERDKGAEILKSLTDKPGNPFVAFDVEEYVAEYEMLGEDDEGREGYYTPSEKEKALIADAIYGVLPQLQGDVRAMIEAAKGE